MVACSVCSSLSSIEPTSWYSGGVFVLWLTLLLVLFLFICEGRYVAMVKHTRMSKFQQNANVVKLLISCRLAMGEWGVMQGGGVLFW